MGVKERFFEYALDFEKTYLDDDWSRLERYFTPDATYEVRNISFASRLEGRDAVLRGLKKSLDGFDRRMKSRSPTVTSQPSEEGDCVSLEWAVTYTKEGAPDFVLRGRSTAHYRGDAIARLVDDFPDGMDEEAKAWGRAHAPDLDPSYA